MAKGKKRTSTGAAGIPSDAADGSAKGESVSGYFRKLFEENPKWLNNRSNDELYSRWLKDHPSVKAVPERIRQNLSNVKSVLRKRGRKKSQKRKNETSSSNVNPPVASTPPRTNVTALEKLEEQIDECLTIAKSLDREGLASVISHLRRARNEVVWKMGE